MASAKIAITLNAEIVAQLDRWVKEGRYPNRSRAIQEALKEHLSHWRRNRLAQEVSKLNAEEEKGMAEESFLTEDESWPEY